MALRISWNSLSILVVVLASFNARMLVPGLWVLWFPWVVPLVGLVPVPGFWGGGVISARKVLF